MPDTDEDLTFVLRRSLQLAKENECPSCKRVIKHRQGLEWCQDRQMSEKTLQDRVRDRAKRRGWRMMHVARAIAAFDEKGERTWITPADPGWPDLFLVNPRMPAGRRAIAMELKKEDGEVSEEQLVWLRLLNESGVPAVVIRPSDLRLGRVNAILEGL